MFQGLTLTRPDNLPTLLLRMGRTLKTSSLVLVPAGAKLLVVAEIAANPDWKAEEGDLIVVRPGHLVFFLLRRKNADQDLLPDESDPVTRAWLQEKTRELPETAATPSEEDPLG